MKNRTPLYGALAVLVLAVGFYFLLWTPRNDDLALIREETAQLETRRSSLQNEIALLREVEADQDRFRAELASLETYIPTGISQPEIVSQLQAAADAAEVEITALAFAPPMVVEDAPTTGTPDTSLARIPVTMSVEGGYFHVADFLRRLERDVPRAIYFGDLTADESEEGFPHLRSTWIGDMFAVVPTTAIPAPAPPADATEGADEGATEAPEGATEAPDEAATAEEVTS